MTAITIVGGGLGGLTAAIACAEGGADVRLLERRGQLGGRARSSDGPFRANLGAHVLYVDSSPTFLWLRERDLLPPYAKTPLAGARFRHRGKGRRMPPRALIAKALRLRRRRAPVDVTFRDWASEHCGEEVARMLCNLAGVFTFDHDPGRLSAAFVWERVVRSMSLPPPPGYVLGGWMALVDRLADRARALGVAIETGAPVGTLPAAPVIVATELADAATLLGDPTLQWESGHALLLDVGMRRRRGDPFFIADLDQAAWVERFSCPDHSLAPPGHELVQAHVGVRPGEPADAAANRLELLLDAGMPDWRAREVWRRRQVMERRTGALDLPGSGWHDRPAVDRGDGVFVAGDQMAAPGTLSEVAIASALEASRLALVRLSA